MSDHKATPATLTRLIEELADRYAKELDNQMFSIENIDDNLLIIDSPALVVDQWLADRAKQEDCNAVPKRGAR